MSPARAPASARARRYAQAAALLGILAVAAASPAAAQVAVGDSLWRLGRIDEAAAAYRRALEEDRLSVRANFRLAQTLAWGNNIDSALVLLRAARVRVPDDPDLLYTEATYLSWARRFDQALVRFDSVITAHPGRDFDHVRIARARMLSWSGRMAEAESAYRFVLARDSASRDARFGLAQVAAWRGDLDLAVARYDSLLASDPTEVRTLVGLGHVRLWQQRPGTAARLAARARARDSTDTEVRDLLRAVRAAAAPRAEVTHDWSEDSERNTNRWQRLTVRGTLGDARVSAALATLHATDPFRSARRALAEVGAVVPAWRGSVTGVLGARQLAPAPLDPGQPAAPERAVLSGRLTLQQRLTARTGVTVTGARWPFDEIAAVTPLALDISQGDVALDWRPGTAWSAVATAGVLHYSDGNRKRTWSARATRRTAGGLALGAFVSGFAFTERRPRYFSPPRFVAGEVTAQWSRETPRWSASVGGGVGAQRIADAETQDQWHVDGQAARHWARWSLELHGGRSTSAAASAVGAYAYSTLGLGLRRTF